MTNEANKQPKKPSHVAFYIREGLQDDSFWTRIGAAWTHKDGNGITIQVDTVPLNGRITLRVATEKRA